MIYNRIIMKIIKTNKLKVVIVTTIPKVREVILAKIRSERKAIKKKKVMAKRPVPTVGYCRSGMRRLKP